jgi:hypothetical protein
MAAAEWRWAERGLAKGRAGLRPQPASERPVNLAVRRLQNEAQERCK